MLLEKSKEDRFFEKSLISNLIYLKKHKKNKIKINYAIDFLVIFILT
jgi:hypothetical protein